MYQCSQLQDTAWLIAFPRRRRSLLASITSLRSFTALCPSSLRAATGSILFYVRWPPKGGHLDSFSGIFFQNRQIPC